MAQDGRKKSIWGIGPKLLSSTLIYFVIMFYISSTDFQIAVASEQIGAIHLVSIALLAIGIINWLVLGRLVVSIYRAGILYRKGIYAFCRHPFYANFIFVLVPGLCLFFNSWLILTTPLFMYFLFKYFINEEEAELIKQFGDAYLQYRQEVNALVPRLR